MNKVKLISNQAGVCPYCNSEDINYGAAKFKLNYIYYPCTCNECKRYFEEWNELHFSGHNVGSSGEYKASDYFEKEIEYAEVEKKIEYDIRKYDSILIENALKLSTRLSNCLRRSDIKTIAQLMSLTDEELSYCRNLGEKSKDEIEAALSEWLGYLFRRKKIIDYIGMTKTMKNGLKATIVDCKGFLSSCDAWIDIKFEDGAIINRTTLRKFRDGNIKHPKEYIGMTKKMKNGLKATIIAYRGKFDIDVQFEDGGISRNDFLYKFEDGNIEYPNKKRGNKL